MSNVDLTVEICGMSGDGTIAAGGFLNAAVAKAGFSVMAFDSYPAEIRGFGRCVTRCRIGDEEMLALSDKTHVLISLDDEQSQSRLSGLAESATVIFDNKPPSMVPEGASLAAHVEAGTNLVGIPFRDLAAQAAGSTRGRNIVALGGFAALFEMPPEYFYEVITKKFQAKGASILEGNLRCFDAGYNYSKEKYADRIADTLSRENGNGNPDRILQSGNIAIGEGAIDAGVRLYFGYPITPATPIMEYLAKALPEKGGKLLQMEDEISSIGAVLGSFYAGTRAMTATSGPGFALMTELITHGVMAEIPAVIINTQRGGPATGLPTKTEQSDLQAAVWGGPGDSARIVLAAANVPECYTYTIKCFQLAEKYQTPVIVLTDFFLNNRVETMTPISISEEEKADWNIYPDKEDQNNFHRYKITESGISPRPKPGMEGYSYTATGLEHSEKGGPDYTPENHMAMNSKRHRKIEGALNDMPVPEGYFVEDNLDLGVISWGSTFGAALEAVQKARSNGIKVGALKITSIYPFHADLIRSFMEKCKNILIPELNYEGQLANLIGHLYDKDVIKLNQTTGVPLYPVEICQKINEITSENLNSSNKII